LKGESVVHRIDSHPSFPEQISAPHCLYVKRIIAGLGFIETKFGFLLAMIGVETA
jgi:hypothetical protein